MARPRLGPGLRRSLVVTAGVAAAVAVVAVVPTGPVGRPPSSADVPPGSYRPVAGLLLNAGFEDGARPDGRPDVWGGGGAGYRLSVDDATSAVGRSSGRLDNMAPSGGKFGTITTCVPAKDLRGGAVRYRGLLRSDEAGWGGLWMRVEGAYVGGSAKTLAFDNMENRAVRGTTGWRRYTIELPVPSAADRICLGFLLVGRGTLWADDLTLEFAGVEI